ncbi:hypothetical protein ACGFNF_24000 [Micromonospora sp. NPDC048868]|uniref:hypothetical protein n=1 Tax=Micromonospora sp. NPDC048868 TaxID=3364258 RepID=UPI0037215068
MTTTPTGGALRAAKANALVLAVLLAAGCTRPTDTAELRPAAGHSPSSSPNTVSIRLDAPETLLDGWNESIDRRLHDMTKQNIGGFKRLLQGEPTSAVGTAYAAGKEKHSAELGVHRPDDSRFVLVSGVSGTVVAPETTLDAVFGALTAVVDVKPVAPGPLGGTARCGTSKNAGIRVEVCGWASPYVIGVIHFGGFKPADNPSRLFTQVRAQVEHPAS